jgi:aspartate aminotransferase-like enzyme
MEAYENGGYAYHATLPTDTLASVRTAMQETRAYGLARARLRQQELGDKVRALLVSRGFKSVAAEGFQAPGVVVSYTDDADIQSGRKFVGLGLQTAAGVPLQCDEAADFRSFRIGLFGLDKLQNIGRTVQHLAHALQQISV